MQRQTSRSSESKISHKQHYNQQQVISILCCQLSQALHDGIRKQSYSSSYLHRFFQHLNRRELGNLFSLLAPEVVYTNNTLQVAAESYTTINMQLSSHQCEFSARQRLRLQIHKRINIVYRVANYVCRAKVAHYSRPTSSWL
jgi:hypothetical protein